MIDLAITYEGSEVCESSLTCLAHENIWITRGQDALPST